MEFDKGPRSSRAERRGSRGAEHLGQLLDTRANNVAGSEFCDVVVFVPYFIWEVVRFKMQ